MRWHVGLIRGTLFSTALEYEEVYIDSDRPEFEELQPAYTVGELMEMVETIADRDEDRFLIEIGKEYRLTYGIYEESGKKLADLIAIFIIHSLFYKLPLNLEKK